MDVMSDLPDGLRLLRNPGQSEYRADALAVAKTQIALAGARLANLINANLR